MFKNYLKIAFRNLIRHKTYSFINIAGLAIGIACCILIFLYVQHEWQHDRFHENADNIFRLMIQETAPDGEITFTTLLPISLSKVLEEEFPMINRATGFIRTGTRITYENQSFYEQFALVDAAFLEMFTFPFIVGDPATALSQPNSVVISESVVHKYFGETEGEFADVLGKVLIFQSEEKFIVTGVMQSVPKTSSLEFDVLIPIKPDIPYFVARNWAGAATVYVQLTDGQDTKVLETALPSFMEKHLASTIKDHRTDIFGCDIKELFQLRLQPLTDIYLNSNIESHYTARGNIFYSYIHSGIAFLVLLTACINFMTLSIGRSASRSMEVGMRKVFGAQRKQVMWQFWGEALLLTLFALLLGIVLAELFLPIFNILARKELTISYFNNYETLLALLGMLAITGIIAGSYPAVVLSRFQPFTVLKGQWGISGRNRFTRTLVVVQYILSIALMVSTGVMSQQINYMRSKDLGYQKEHVIVVSVPNDITSERYKNKLLQYDKIISAAGSDRSFTSGYQTRGVKKEGGGWDAVRIIRIDSDYLETLGIELIAGRNFFKALSTDTTQSVIVNETFIKIFGWTEPLGKRLEGLGTRDEQPPPAIIGVVKDFHIDRLHREIRPLALSMNPDFHGIYHVFIRIRPDDIPGTIVLLKETWEEIAPDQPFQYAFLDENLKHQYRNEQRWHKIVGYACVFAILISCMGILGLASLAVTRRTKEIGIRKVLGASIADIVSLLIKEFILLVVVAIIIACPIGWYIMDKWLQNFSYRIDFAWWIFALAGALTVMIVLLTVSWQAIKAALANPVESLRYE
ncbi:ABC transporter permease [bacterium]|nr:ABC transporter permease [bacterium]MBU1633160.1 ABC transporter permease [bacterium]MBU1873867.1 ABC transporter permease [bacterium]